MNLLLIGIIMLFAPIIILLLTILLEMDRKDLLIIGSIIIWFIIAFTLIILGSLEIRK